MREIRFADIQVEWVDNDHALYKFTLMKNDILKGWALREGGSWIDFGKGYPKVSRRVKIDGKFYDQIAMYCQGEWRAASVIDGKKKNGDGIEWRFGNWEKTKSIHDALVFLEEWEPGMKNRVKYLEREINKLKGMVK